MKLRGSIFVLVSLLATGCTSITDPIKGFGEGVVGLFSGGKDTFDVSKGDLTQEEEYWLGKAVSAQILVQYPPSEDQALNDYVIRAGQALAGYSERPSLFGGYSFQVLKSDTVNGLSAPGGFIFVTEGFVKLLRNEEDLAAILAHEIGHIQAKHGIASIEQSHKNKGLGNGGEVLSALSCAQSLQLLTAAFDGAIKDVMNKLLHTGYSKEQEYEADAIAKKILEESGYSPLGLAEVLTKLHEQKLATGGIFSTHPAAIDRLNALHLPLGATATGISPVRDNRFNHTGR